MARYLIQSPHTKEECFRVLDWVLEYGSQLLTNYDFGCMCDDHTGYLIVDVPSETDARYTIPPFIRKEARIIELNKFTVEQIMSLRQSH